MTVFQKYAGEQESYDVDFTPRLAADETITAQTVTIYRWVLNTSLLVTDVLLETSGVLENTNAVQFQLKAGNTETQPEGWYTVKVAVVTNTGRSLESDWDLQILPSVAARVS